MELATLILLALVPWLAWRYARKHVASHLWCITGVSLGAVISPLSIGLYSTFFLGPAGLPTGMLGLVSTLFHGPPGFHLAHWLSLAPYGVASGTDRVYMEALNGVVWAAVYGLIGALVDRWRSRGARAVAP